MTPLPESPYCRVRARVAAIWADGPDDGTHPDWRPAVGERVTLTPSIGAQLLVYDVAGPAPIIVTVERVHCEADADGWLVNDGRPVFIAPTDDPLLSATGWTWTATIKGKAIDFSAPAGGVVDLALFVASPAVDSTEYVSVVQIVADYIAANPPDVEQAVADWLTANPPSGSPDATALTKGIVRLAGDLGGTADAPTVPGLADKADADHTHTLADITDYSPPDLSGYATNAALTSGLSGKAAAIHGHTISNVSGLQSALDGKQPAGTYAPALGADDNYVTDAEKVKLANLSGTNTGDQTLPTWSTIAGKPAVVAEGATAAAARTAIGAGTSSFSGAYADLSGKPTIPDSPDDIGAAPAAHDHTATDIGSGAALDGHVLTADGAGGAAWEAPPAGGGGGGGATVDWVTLTQAGQAITLPSAAQGSQYVVVLTQDSTGGRSATWPETVTWEGGALPSVPTGPSERAVFTLLSTGDGWLGFTSGMFAAPTVPDTTSPTAGVLSASTITASSFRLTVTGASDDVALDAQPYRFSLDNGGTFSNWQTSPDFDAASLTAETVYTCIHQVRDAAGNPASTGNSITVTTLSAAVPSIFDSFTRANSTTGLGVTDTGHTWVQVGTGVVGVISNMAYRATSNATAVVDFGQADMHVSHRVAVPGDYFAGHRARYVDSANFYALETSSVGGTGQAKVMRTIAGTSGAVGGVTVVPSVAAGDVLGTSYKEVAGGTEIKVYKNGVLLGTMLDSTTGRPMGTKAGISPFNNSAIRIDDFTVEVPE